MVPGNNPAIILGDPGTVTRLGPTGTNNLKWEQIESNTIAHFVQSVSYVSSSSWRKADIKFPITPNAVEPTMPDLESFAFAAIYFRQLSPEEKLLDDAVAAYAKHSNSSVKTSWITAEQEQFNKSWLRSATLEFFVTSVNTFELFQAFLYGGFLIHGPKKKSSRKAIAKFTKLFDSIDQTKILATLHWGLHEVANHAINIAAVMKQDFAEWTSTGLAPHPIIRWQRQLFKPGALNRVDASA